MDRVIVVWYLWYWCFILFCFLIRLLIVYQMRLTCRFVDLRSNLIWSKLCLISEEFWVWFRTGELHRPSLMIRESKPHIVHENRYLKKHQSFGLFLVWDAWTDLIFLFLFFFLAAVFPLVEGTGFFRGPHSLLRCRDRLSPGLPALRQDRVPWSEGKLLPRALPSMLWRMETHGNQRVRFIIII